MYSISFLCSRMLNCLMNQQNSSLVQERARMEAVRMVLFGSQFKFYWMQSTISSASLLLSRQHRSFAKSCRLSSTYLQSSNTISKKSVTFYLSEASTMLLKEQMNCCKVGLSLNWLNHSFKIFSLVLTSMRLRIVQKPYLYL